MSAQHAGRLNLAPLTRGSVLLRAVVPSMRQSQGVCKFFLSSGSCNHGNACRFSHEIPQAMQAYHGAYQQRQQWQQPRYGGGGRGQQHGGGGSGRLAYEERRWSQGEPAKADTAPGPEGSMRFRFMTWNLLADELAMTHRNELYPRVPPSALDWRQRWQMATEELRHTLPDVLCLQEVDHWDDVRQAMAQLGYQGTYLKRTGGRTDGCATFWRATKFQAHTVVPIRYQDYNMKDNVALIVLLEQLPRAQQPPAQQQQKQQKQDQDNQKQSEPKQGNVQGPPKLKSGQKAKKAKVPKLQQNSMTTEDTGSGVEDSDRSEQRRQRKEQLALENELQQQQAFGQEQNEDKRSRQQREADAAGARNSAPSPNPQPHKRLRPGSAGGADADHATSAAAVSCAPDNANTGVPHNQPGSTAAGNDAAGVGNDTAEAGMNSATHPGAAAAGGIAGATTPLLAVGNTHVLFNIKRGDVKLGQLRLLLEGMARAAQQKAPGRDVLHIATGDFNASPHSPLYQFVTTGELDCLPQDRRIMAGVIQGAQGQRAIQYNTANTTPLGQNQQWPMQQASGMHLRWDAHGVPVNAQMPWQQAQMQVQAWGQGMGMQQQQQPYGQQNPWAAAAAAAAAIQQQQMSQSWQQVQQAPAQHLPASVQLHAERYMMQLQAGQEALEEGAMDVDMEVDVETVTVQLGQQQVGLQQQRRTLTAHMLRCSGWNHDELATATGMAAGQQRQERQAQVQAPPPQPQPQPLQQHAQVQAQQEQEKQQQQQQQQHQERQSKPSEAIDAGEEGELLAQLLQDDAGAPDGQQQQDQGGLTRQERQRQQRQAAAAAKREREALEQQRRVESLGDGVARHPLQLGSAYMDVTGSEPAFSSVHHKFSGTLDYIMYQKDATGSWQLRPLSVLHPPPKYHVAQGLPSRTLPSDHISLACDFEVVPVAGRHGNKERTRRQG